jgi:hypothetical protein
MKKNLSIFLIILLLTGTAYGQNFEPLELAKKIFGKDSLANMNQYVTGEYNGRPNGQNLQMGSTTKFTLLGQTTTKAVVGMCILDSTGKGLDTYLHFEKDSTWKMNAFRALAMSGIIEQIKNELEKMTSKEVDELIKKSKKDKHPIFKSRQDYDFQLGNAKLTLELDENIQKHFLGNEKEFERIKDLALKQLGNERADNERSIHLVEDNKSDYRKLFISSVSTGGYELGNCIKFLIGGMIDNTVGYLFIKDKNDLPEMNPDRVIMLKEIGNGWYIYKTT